MSNITNKLKYLIVAGIGILFIGWLLFASFAGAVGTPNGIENGGYWTDWKDTTRCIQTECGSEEGLKGQEREYVQEVCEYSCPSFYFKWWDRGWKEANVVYEKSEDPHKCHRPSDATLMSKYGMNRGARFIFKRTHSEWEDAIKGECRLEVLNTEARRVPCRVQDPEPCGTIRWCFPTCGDHEYEASAIPNNETPEEGKPWEEGMDKWCEYPLEPEPEPEPEPEARGTTPAGPPPVCVAVDLGDWAPTITEVGRIDNDTVYAKWTKSTDNADHYVVWFGTSEDNLPWNTIVQGEYVELNDVPNTHIWLKVAATDLCIVGPYSTTVDP